MALTNHYLQLLATQPEMLAECEFADSVASGLLAAAELFAASSGRASRFPLVDTHSGNQIGEVILVDGLPQETYTDAHVSIRLYAATPALRGIESLSPARQCAQAIREGSYPAVLRRPSTGELVARIEIRTRDAA